MKKYLCAKFMLELIIESGSQVLDVELRDVNGNICARGDVSSVSDFIKDAYDQFLMQKSNISAENK